MSYSYSKNRKSLKADSYIEHYFIKDSETKINFAYIIILVLIIFVFGKDGTKETRGKQEEVDFIVDKIQEEVDFTTYNEQEVPFDLLPYLYLIILIELFNSNSNGQDKNEKSAKSEIETVYYDEESNFSEEADDIEYISESAIMPIPIINELEKWDIDKSKAIDIIPKFITNDLGKIKR